MSTEPVLVATVITPEALLNHWQGHRKLTRRVISAFPEAELFTFSIGGMRPFGALVAEMLGMGAPMVRGVVTGEWSEYSPTGTETQEELLRQWDAATEELQSLWPRIPPDSFQRTITAFGQYTGPGYDLLLYVIDNEVHHRAQGYVYLRALGKEPPPFYERG